MSLTNQTVTNYWKSRAEKAEKLSAKLEAELALANGALRLLVAPCKTWRVVNGTLHMFIEDQDESACHRAARVDSKNNNGRCLMRCAMCFARSKRKKFR